MYVYVVLNDRLHWHFLNECCL